MLLEELELVELDEELFELELDDELEDDELNGAVVKLKNTIP